MSKHLILDIYGTLRSDYDVAGLIADLRLKCTTEVLREKLNKEYWCHDWDLCNSQEESTRRLVEILNTNAPKQKVLKAYITNRGKVNKDLLQLIIAMTTKNLKVGTLSDCGILMAIDNKEFAASYKMSFCFNSSIEGVGKWEERCYPIVRSRLGCKPKEVFFIDDSEQNIEYARQAGWNTYLWTEEDQDKIIEEIKKEFHL